ncbi:MAG: hypothetical protein CMM94_05870 [Rickettsiales bacterium]|nr:hypothetical protein [Rickettsiales bacterium]
MPNSSTHRPYIGVSGQKPDSHAVRMIMQRIRENGEEPVFLDRHAPVADVVARCDGIVIAGNDFDIDPSEYGQEALPTTKIDADQSRSQFERALVDAALEKKIPLMGICAGMQRINLSGSPQERGSLHQHVEGKDQREAHANGHDSSLPLDSPYETITLEPDSLVHQLAGADTIQENSMHHQAIDKVRKGLRVTAWADNGLAEAIEQEKDGPFADQLVLGVQWHPEFYASKISANLFAHFTEKSREFAQHKTTERPSPVESVLAAGPRSDAVHSVADDGVVALGARAQAHADLALS